MQRKSIRLLIAELSVVLYGCGTRSLILRKEHDLSVLRREFGHKREELEGGESSSMGSFLLHTLRLA
jgi:hypothetical protein